MENTTVKISLSSLVAKCKASPTLIRRAIKDGRIPVTKQGKDYTYNPETWEATAAFPVSIDEYMTESYVTCADVEQFLGLKDRLGAYRLIRTGAVKATKVPGLGLAMTMDDVMKGYLALLTANPTTKAFSVPKRKLRKRDIDFTQENVVEFLDKGDFMLVEDFFAVNKGLDRQFRAAQRTRA